MQAAILLPAIALVLLTAIVWVRLYVERLREIRQRRIDPQSLATSAAAGQTLKQVQASDNLGTCSVGAWLYVALRYVHSFIHLTYNRVTHRLRSTP